MRLLKYYVACSINGFIARENGAFDYFLMEGDHIADYHASLASFDAVLMGRKTYEVGLREGVTDPYPTMKTYVFTRTLRESPSPNVQLVAEDPAGAVRALKNEQGKDIWLCGGSEIAAALFAEDLIDEVILKVHPVIVGAGVPAIAGGVKDMRFDLRETRVFSSGITVQRYRIRR